MSAPEPRRLTATTANAARHPASATPYLDALRRYADRDPARLMVPGHKGGLAAPMSLLRELVGGVVALDVPQLIEGVDQETGRPSPFELAERRAAVAWGAARTWFLTGGASQGNLAASLAVASAGQGRRAAVQRSSHSSTFNGVALAGLNPTTIMPAVDGRLGIAHGVTPAALDAALAQSPAGVNAVFVVSPTYFGACADVAGLAAVAHRHGAALIVDEAWGAHLRFSPELPADAISCGADLVVSSTHKHLGSLGGSAMLHLGPDAPAWLSEACVDRALGLVTSTSPSSLLMGSLDAARARAEVEGPHLLAMAVRELTEVRESLRTIPGLDVVDQRWVGQPGFAGLDPMRLTIDVRGTGRTGYELAAALRTSAGVELELAQERVVVAVFGVGESPLLSAGPLVDGLLRLSSTWLRASGARGRAADVLASGTNRRPAGGTEISTPPTPRATCTPREALWSPSELIPVEQAHGRVAAEALVPYPPGIPALLPGEIIDSAALLALRDAVRLGAHLRGAADPTLQRVRVVDDPLAALEQSARVSVPGLR